MYCIYGRGVLSCGKPLPVNIPVIIFVLLVLLLQATQLVCQLFLTFFYRLKHVKPTHRTRAVDLEPRRYALHVKHMLNGILTGAVQMTRQFHHERKLVIRKATGADGTVQVLVFQRRHVDSFQRVEKFVRDALGSVFSSVERVQKLEGQGRAFLGAK